MSSIIFFEKIVFILQNLPATNIYALGLGIGALLQQTTTIAVLLG